MGVNVSNDFLPIAFSGCSPFTFSTYNAHDMQEAVWRAIGFYSNKSEWENLKNTAMSCDSSWKRSAGEYLKIYKKILGK